MRRIFISLLLVIPVLTGCNGGDKGNSGWSDTIVVEAMVVSDGNNTGEREYVGEIGSEVEVDLGFALGGKLTKVTLKNGDKVRKGQLLA